MSERQTFASLQGGPEGRLCDQFVRHTRSTDFEENAHRPKMVTGRGIAGNRISRK
jgi:hypothetical protein